MRSKKCHSSKTTYLHSRNSWQSCGAWIVLSIYDTDPDPETYRAENMTEEPASIPSDLPSEEIGTDEEDRVGEEYRTDTEDDGSWWD